MALPLVRHLILCEKIVGPAPGKNYSVESIVYTLRVKAGTAKPAFPRLHPRMFLFVALTGRDRHQFGVDLVYWRQGTEEPVSSRPFPSEIDLGADPLDVRLLAVPMENIVFAFPGDYEFVLRSDGSEIGRVAVHVEEKT